ncbi:uncharacterized protein TRIADDRAFT_50516 [Trichoplax adhaerens]|uniref:Methyltransferase HEMK2 n=1 Tax=Trichoplax adhaerens TaxID=10228 RepID=B3S159_TRIAD|nr:hypothetical protein TRIADDRAFT_50516 [Trichoplax adhaerens]EDV23508.1 hypothetical protein TRIADDRAFT_50516 [Trichoplax adhaerens]|eukprot:XP_002114418.1 hypothetical protein TRIADDRAFT_50516 [Trichoplax adhaerens]
MDYPTPSISHLSRKPYVNYVYDAAEDTFLFMDALQNDAILPLICIEVGSGSGAIISFISKILGPECYYMATDINPIAANCTIDTAKLNEMPQCEVIITDLVSGLKDRLTGNVDVILFNPPYVVTPSKEISGNGIEASWAGGENGREVMDRLFTIVPQLLSPSGLFYLVAIKENYPDEIIKTMKMVGLSGEIILSRKAGRENLFILRFDKENSLS